MVDFSSAVSPYIYSLCLYSLALTYSFTFTDKWTKYNSPSDQRTSSLDTWLLDAVVDDYIRPQNDRWTTRTTNKGCRWRGETLSLSLSAFIPDTILCTYWITRGLLWDYTSSLIQWDLLSPSTHSLLWQKKFFLSMQFLVCKSKDVPDMEPQVLFWSGQAGSVVRLALSQSPTQNHLVLR